MRKEAFNFWGSKKVFGTIAAAWFFLALFAPLAFGQQSVKRILAQDSTLNNLVDPPGYQTAPLGSLGNVKKAGKGTQAMILVAGLGFSADIFDDFMAQFADRYKIYAVTLPGFGGTAAPPCPPEKTSFGEQTWTNGAIAGIEKLMKDENIQNPIIVGHWLGGTQIALRLAMKHPDKVKGVVLLAGAARLFTGDTAYARYYATLEKRVATIDNFFAPRWFKTVTRETWDDNNFLPGDYATNPVLGLRLWRQAASPKLHVWVRYLCEFNAQDITGEMGKLAVPTLILKPGLEGIFHDPKNNYMENYCDKGWGDSIQNNPKITVKTIPNSRVCLWFDQPEAVHQAVVEFLKSVE